MAFLKTRNGVWYVYWSADGKKHGRSLHTDSKRMADECLHEFEYKLAKKQLGQETDVSLDRLRQEYLEYSKSTKKHSAYARHDVPRVNRFVDYAKGHGLTKASQIRQVHVESYQQALLKDLAPNSVRHSMYAASGLLSFAVRRGYISHNVVKSVQKVKAQKNPPRYLSFEEWEKVKQVARQTHLWPLVAAAYYAGFRNSELRFLTWEEIDFDNDLITIRNKEGFSLKNRESRTIPLNQELKAVLLPVRRPRGRCFTDAHGKPFVTENVLPLEFKKLIVKPSGLPDFSLHTLRHTFASHLVMRGVSIYKVSQWLGHSSVNTTMIYAHLAPQDDEINVL